MVVPWSHVKIRPDKDGKEVAMIDRAALDSAPRYTADRDRDRDRTGAASPRTSPSGDRDRDGVSNKYDRAPNNPNKQ